MSKTIKGTELTGARGDMRPVMTIMVGLTLLGGGALGGVKLYEHDRRQAFDAYRLYQGDHGHSRSSDQPADRHFELDYQSRRQSEKHHAPLVPPHGSGRVWDRLSSMVAKVPVPALKRSRTPPPPSTQNK
jgi:hypothetical protein